MKIPKYVYELVELGRLRPAPLDEQANSSIAGQGEYGYMVPSLSEEQQSIRRSVCCRGGTYNSLGTTGVRGIQHSYIPLVH